MNPRKLVLLLMVFVVLLGTVLLVSRPPRRPAMGTVQAGDKVLPELDLNAVRAVQVAGPDGTASLARVEGVWVAGDLHGYPVNFEDLRQRLRALADLEIGQVADGEGTELLEEYGLGAAATRITLSAEDGSALAEVNLGKAREGRREGPYGGGFPDGHYLRVGGGPVLLVAERVGPYPVQSTGWIEKQLLDVSSSDLQAVNVSSTNGSYTVTFEDGPAMEGLADDEEIDSAGADRLRRGLQYLNCTTVAGPAHQDGLGFDQPASFTATAKDGVTYTVLLGGDSGEGRYARFSFAYAEPPEVTRAEAEALVPESAGTNREEQVEAELTELQDARREQIDSTREKLEELAALEPWTFVLSTYTAGNLSLARDEVVKKIEPPADEAGPTDEDGVGNEAPLGMPAP